MDRAHGRYALRRCRRDDHAVVKPRAALPSERTGGGSGASTAGLQNASQPWPDASSSEDTRVTQLRPRRIKKERALLHTEPMTFVEFILYLVIAGICGAVARAIAGGTSRGFIVSILVGFVGAFLGVWIARMTRLPRLVVVTVEGHPFPIVWSIVGGIVLVTIAQALLPRRHLLY